MKKTKHPTILETVKKTAQALAKAKHTPNKKTIKAIKDADKRKTHKAKSVKSLFKKK